MNDIRNIPAVGPTAKSLILDLLTTLRDGAMPVRALVAAGALFGIGENNMRVSLARLLSARVVVRDERGSYRLGERAEPVRSRVASWRQVGERVRDWNGGWIALQPTAVRSSSAAKQRWRQAPRFLGFRALHAGLLLRPDNLAAEIAGVREQLLALGLDKTALVFGATDFDAQTEARARTLWDGDSLREQYAQMSDELERSRERLAQLDPGEAMVESFLVGGKTLRLIALDPLLPEALAPSAPRKALVEAMTSYDRQGRICWSAFMADFGLPHLRAPLDLRIASDASVTPRSASRPARAPVAG